MWIRLGASRLSIGITETTGVVVATLVGVADESALATILDGGIRLLEEASGVVVLDLRDLEETAGAGAEALSRVVREAQRLEQEVRLVGCGEGLARDLRSGGLRGDFWHYPSLAAATDGLVSEPGHAVTVHIRRGHATRARLRLIVASLARPCALDDEDQARLVVALDDVCGLAAQNGACEEEPITISFFARHGLLTADVGWRVPPGRRCDEETLWAKRPDARARISGALDQVETLSQADGYVIRLVRRTGGEAPPVAPEPPAALPDSTLERLTRSTPAPPKRARRFSWGKWSLRPRFAFVTGIAGRAGHSEKLTTGEKKDGKGS